MKKLKLSFTKKTESTSELPTPKPSRFAAPASEKEVSEVGKGVVPSNIKKTNTRGRAQRTFDD